MIKEILEFHSVPSNASLVIPIQKQTNNTIVDSFGTSQTKYLNKYLNSWQGKIT